MKGSSLETEGSKIPFIAATALQVFPQEFPFFFSLWAWGEVQLAAHMLGIHALLFLFPGCGCSVPFVLTLPLFKWLASALQPGKRKPRLLSISCHQNVSQRKGCCSLWLPWQMVSWSRLQKDTTVGKRIKWACRKLWGPLAVSWAKGMTHRNRGNVCCRHSSGWWWPILSKMNTVFTLFWALFFMLCSLIMNSFPYMQDIENII